MKRFFAVLLTLCCLFSACGAPEPASSDAGARTDFQWEYETELVDLNRLGHGKPVLICEVGPYDWSRGEWIREKEDYWGYDVRSFDLSGEDLSDIEDRNSFSFDTKTIWPEMDKLPPDFDVQAILELGKDPGLGIRALHEQGITGEGVSIAIIDQGLYTGHEQYRENLMLYEWIHKSSADTSSMHGAAVSSIAVGKDTGVAPGARLYYIGSTLVEFTDEADEGYIFDASIMAQCIDRVLQINTQLPENDKIRVISISRGVEKTDPGFSELAAVVERANEQGVLVLTATTEVFYDFQIMGMERECMADPNDPASYTPAAWLGTDQPWILENTVGVPMGARTYASFSGGAADYEWSGESGISWAVPWMAGFYALCCQVEPELTPEQFIRVVNETAVLELKNGDLDYDYGKIIDPAAVIAALRDA